MQTIEILDVKPFMQLLFQTESFDTYEFVSAELHTDMFYSIDGHINQNFFSAEEIELHRLENHSYLPWCMTREKVFLLIRGKKTPSLLKIVFKISESQLQSIVSETNSSLNPNDIDGLFLNISFQNNKLNVICGISYKIFTLDKELESEFFDKIITFLKYSNIACQ